MPALAITLTVPDDSPTIQAALDSGAEYVLIRPGTYAETPIIRNPVALRGLAGSPDSLPAIAGLILDDIPPSWDCKYSGVIRVTGLRFTGPVANTFETNPCSNPLGIWFERCVLDSGLTDAPATEVGQVYWTLLGCAIVGDVRITKPLRITVDSTRVQGTIVAFADEGVLIRWNHVEGPNAVGIDATCGEDVLVLGNSVTDCDVGIRAGSRSSMGVTVQNNTIERSSRLAIDVGGADPAILVGNTVRSCGAVASVRGDVRDLSGNVVEDCVRGIELQVSGVVDGNRVARSGSGIVIRGLASATRNTVIDCPGIGIELEGGSLGVHGNRVERCTGAGIRMFAGGETMVSRNTIVACGGGISIGGSDIGFTAIENTILYCDGTGISGGGGLSAASIRQNVVGRCGGGGVSFTNYGSFVLRGNTLFLNGAFGCQLVGTDDAYQAFVDHNVSYGNRGAGLLLSNATVTAMSCNDWFANESGAVIGGAADPSDLAVDPRFCDLGENDVHLQSSSPLANAPGCGLIGALGVACDDAPTPVLVSRFETVPTAGGIEVRWRVSAAAGEDAIHLERAGRDAGPWVPVAGRPSPEGDLMVLIDRDAAAGGPTWYRLVLEGALGSQVVGGPIAARAQVGGAFELLGIMPNPGAGRIRVGFGLAAAAPIRIELFDLQGRLRAVLAQGLWPAGRHEVEWLGAGAAPGLYLVRYTHPGGQQCRRLIVSR